MKIEPTITAEAFAELSEEIQETYVKQDDGTYVLEGLIGWESPESIESLKKALSEERLGHKENKKQASALQKLIDGLGGMDNLDSLREVNETLTTLQTKLARKTAEGQVLQALQKAGGNPALLTETILKRVKVTGADGDSPTLTVTTGDGKPMLDDEGSSMDLDSLISGFKADPDFAGAFKGSGHSGSDSIRGTAPPHLNGNSEQKYPPHRSEMTPHQKVDYIKERGSEAFHNLPL